VFQLPGPTSDQRRDDGAADDSTWALRPAEVLALLLGLFAFGLVATIVIFRPWTPATGYDSASSVLYFDRLASGRTMEGLTATTTKPMVTLISGLSYNLLHDWRLPSFLAAFEFAGMLALAALLAWRTSGPVAAGTAAFGLLGSQRLLWDGLLTYANPWAIMLWIVAGLALTSKSPRYGVAGTVLLLAALLRVETFLIVGVAALVLLAWQFAPPRWIPGVGRPPRRAWLLLAPVAALPIMCVHDWLLTRDAFFWMEVSATFSTNHAGAVQTPTELSQSLVDKGWSAVLVAGPLALVGGLDLLRRRRFVVALGLAAIGPGVVAFLLLLAFRHTYVSYRYVIPLDAALVMASAFGVDALARLAVRAGRRAARGSAPGAAIRPSRGNRARYRLALGLAAILVGALASVAVDRPYGPLDQSTLTTIDKDIAIQTNVDRATPTIAAALRAMPDAATWAAGNLARPASGSKPCLYVPGPLIPRMIVDFGLPVWAVAGGTPAGADPSTLAVDRATIVYIDEGAATSPQPGNLPFEVTAPTQVGHALVTPLLSLPDSGLWVLELTPSGG
jgi:hypothetical protein